MNISKHNDTGIKEHCGCVLDSEGILNLDLPRIKVSEGSQMKT